MVDDHENLVADLLELLGEDGYFRLCDKLAGVRLPVPKNPDRSELPSIVGEDVANLLCKAYPGSYVKVPLARTLRARRYREAGLSNRDIATRMGLTESAVEKIFIREKRIGRELISPRNPNLQLDLFRPDKAMPAEAGTPMRPRKKA